MFDRPKLGQLVHYYSHGSPDGRYPSTCRMAWVTDPIAVEGHRSDDVSLCVVHPTGMSFPARVSHDAGTEADTMSFGDWPGAECQGTSFIPGSWHYPVT